LNKKYALVKDGIVVNIAVATEEFATEFFAKDFDHVIEVDPEVPGSPSRGWGWDGKKFIPAESV